jgi:L-lactate permease
MVVEDVVLELGRVGKWIQAVGLLVILWIVVEAITLYFNRKRRKLLESIDKRLVKIERKLGVK